MRVQLDFIPVTDRIPTDEIPSILIIEDGNIYEAVFEYGTFSNFETGRTYQATHWCYQPTNQVIEPPIVR